MLLPLSFELVHPISWHNYVLYNKKMKKRERLGQQLRIGRDCHYTVPPCIYRLVVEIK